MSLCLNLASWICSGCLLNTYLILYTYSIKDFEQLRITVVASNKNQNNNDYKQNERNLEVGRLGWYPDSKVIRETASFNLFAVLPGICLSFSRMPYHPTWLEFQPLHIQQEESRAEGQKVPPPSLDNSF